MWIPVVLGGCTTMGETFTRHPADQVWTAMIDAANSPTYDDWKVATNEVYVVESQRRIEIFREVERVLYRADAPPHAEDRTWRFEITLLETDPPHAEFVSRGFGKPTDARAESRRFFGDVYDVLADVPIASGADLHDEDATDSMGLDESD